MCIRDREGEQSDRATGAAGPTGDGVDVQTRQTKRRGCGAVERWRKDRRRMGHRRNPITSTSKQ
eukprot:6079271-Alexandrium_andersonii.AAC.1